MRAFAIVVTLLFAASCSGSIYGPVSTQYHTQDHYGGYSYGYAGPESQKHETRSADGTTHGSYSYVDGHGLLQSVSYVADAHNGFRATGTNFPQAPAPAAIVAAHAAPYAYAAVPHYGYHVPAITPLGVPADTPEVAAAKAAHYAAHAAARYGHHLHKRSLWGGHAAWAPAPVIHNGVPVDTPEVQHAKAAHFAAHAKAAAENHAVAAYAAPLAAAHGAYHVPVIHNGVPVDTPEVQHAKAAHFAAVAKASAGAPAAHPEAYAHPGAYAHPEAYAHAPAAPYHGPIHIPVIHNGVPVEPAEVQHAKAAHLAALSAASAQSGYGAYHDGGHWSEDGQYRHDAHGW